MPLFEANFIHTPTNISCNFNLNHNILSNTQLKCKIWDEEKIIDLLSKPGNRFKTFFILSQQKLD